jgi:hypothetical protein
VGGKNSAAIVALELYRAGATVTLVHRGARLGASVKYWIKPDIENRIQEGSIAARFETRVVEITPDDVAVEDASGRHRLSADAVLLLTGYHPDCALLEAAGVRVDPATLVPEHDRETLETNVPGLYLAGAVVSGRETGRIFIENYRFHGRAIVDPSVAAPAAQQRRAAPRRAWVFGPRPVPKNTKVRPRAARDAVGPRAQGAVVGGGAAQAQIAEARGGPEPRLASSSSVSARQSAAPRAGEPPRTAPSSQDGSRTEAARAGAGPGSRPGGHVLE